MQFSLLFYLFYISAVWSILASYFFFCWSIAVFPALLGKSIQVSAFILDFHHFLVMLRLSSLCTQHLLHVSILRQWRDRQTEPPLSTAVPNPNRVVNYSSVLFELVSVGRLQHLKIKNFRTRKSKSWRQIVTTGRVCCLLHCCLHCLWLTIWKAKLKPVPG